MTDTEDGATPEPKADAPEATEPGTDGAPPGGDDAPADGVHEEGKTQADPPPQPAKADNVPFDKEDEPFLKKMHKDASTHFGKKIVALKEQLTEAQQAKTDLQSKLDSAEGKKLPDTWYEHEEAYKLSPQYNEIAGNFEKEQQATHFWHQQLLRCKANASLRDDQPFIPYQMPGQDGKLVNVTEEQYSADHEVTLNDLRQHHYGQQTKLSDEAKKISDEFAKTHKATDQNIRAAINEKLPWTKDEKHPAQKTFKAILSKIPAAHRNNPFAYAFAAMTTQGLAWLAERNELQGKKKAAAEVEADQKAAGPIPGRPGTGKKKGDDVHYKPEDMAGL